MPKKKPIKRRGRRNAFDAALDKAVKRHGVCLQLRQRHLRALDDLAAEIPSLERIIEAHGGTVAPQELTTIATPGRFNIPDSCRKVPQAIQESLQTSPTFASAGLVRRLSPEKEMTAAEATALAGRTVAADKAVRARLITSIPANNGTPTGDANILDGTGVRESGDDALPDVEGRVLAEGGE